MEKDPLTPACRLLLIGGSAGSLDVLLQVLPSLDAVPFPIVVVLHRKSAEDTALEELLVLKSRIPVLETEDKTPLLPNRLYVAPADYHLLFEKNGVISLDTSEKVNYSRPSIDVSFESAAEAYGDAVAALLLSGANADGTDGLKAIAEAGGRTAVQDPETAEIRFMPQHALQHVPVDAIVNIESMASFISGLT